jgi:hypothetical protein
MATLIREVITLPGARVIDDCPWNKSSMSGRIRSPHSRMPPSSPWL